MSGEEQSEYVFTWRIKNYSSCYHTKGEYIQSPGFAIDIGTLCGSQWSLRLYPKGGTWKFDENNMGCFLDWKALNENVKTITMSYSLEILDEKNNVLKCYKLINRNFKKETPSWGWNKFFATNDELDKQMSSWAEDILTIRCRLKIDEQHEQTIVGSVACTTIDVDRFCVDWYVEILSLYDFSKSITFPISNLYNLDITLNSMLDVITILIHFKDDESEDDEPRQLKFTISIFDKNGCKLGSKRAVHLFKNEETWTFPEFITMELLQACKMNLSQYEFKLKCEVCISTKNISSNSVERLEFASLCSLKSKPRDNPTSAILKEFQNLFINKLYCDVTIRGKSDEFPAHKFVLKVRSPVFAVMFEQDMLENKTGVVDIVDLDGKTLKAFLEYLYTETVGELDYDIAKKLMLTADKYQVPSLVDECASFLKSNVSIENVCEIIAIADLLNCENLKSYALNFIQINAAEILPTAAWAEWIEGNIKLATYILSKFSAAISTSALH